jgi:protein-S-isoprenylcysteine O-methyltransferase Ste14
MKQPPVDKFRAARLRRKRQTKWWREHIPLAYVVLTGTFALFYFSIAFIFGSAPAWLRRLGVTPSGVSLLFGTVSLAIGIWGLKRNRNYGIGWVFIYLLCVAGGVLNIAKALGFL